jgi:SPP1 gp7 family putative phage head morphogenesis protein
MASSGSRKGRANGKKFERYLAAMAKEIQKIVGDVSDIEEADAAAARLSRYERTMAKWADDTARKMVTEADKINARDWVNWDKAQRAEYVRGRKERGELISNALRRERLTRPQNEMIQALSKEAAGYIKSVAKDVQQEIVDKAAEYRNGGIRSEDFVSYVQSRGGVSESRARLIARTEISRATTILTQSRAESVGSTHYIWRTSMDGIVRDSHKDMEGQVVAWNDPPTLDGLTGHAGALPNCRCIPGEDFIDLRCGCQKLFRRKFEGSIVELILSDGTNVRATPNHPTLTRDGWRSIDTLQEGTDVFKLIRDCVVATENEHCKFITRFKDCWDSASKLSLGEIGPFSIPASKTDFHGDGTEDYVDVISANGFLGNNFIFFGTKPIDDFDFSIANVFSRNFMSLLFETLASVMNAASKGDGDEIILRDSASFNIIYTENPGNGSSTAFVLLSKREFGHTREILGDNLGLRQFVKNNTWSFDDFLVLEQILNDTGRTAIFLRELSYAFARLILSNNSVGGEPFSHRSIPLVSDRDFSLLQKSYNIINPFSQFFADSVSAGTVDILLDNIVLLSLWNSINKRPIIQFCHPLCVIGKNILNYSGDVYNAQTTYGYYSTSSTGKLGGIIVHNCYPEPLIPEEMGVSTYEQTEGKFSSYYPGEPDAPEVLEEVAVVAEPVEAIQISPLDPPDIMVAKGAPMEPDEAIKDVNPKYKRTYKGNSPYEVNCQRCVPAYELRRRGYDVTAMPALRGKNITDLVFSNYHYGNNVFVDTDGKRMQYNKPRGKTGLLKELQAYPDGSRFAVRLDWKHGGGAHVFSAEKKDGQVYFFDPQTGKLDAKGHLDDGKKFGYFRIDTAKFNPDLDINLVVEEVKKP